MVGYWRVCSSGTLRSQERLQTLLVTFSNSAQHHRGRSTGRGECLDPSKVGDTTGGTEREGARTLGVSGGVGKGLTMSASRTRKETTKKGLAGRKGMQDR